MGSGKTPLVPESCGGVSPQSCHWHLIHSVGLGPVQSRDSWGCHPARRAAPPMHPSCNVSAPTGPCSGWGRSSPLHLHVAVAFLCSSLAIALPSRAWGSTPTMLSLSGKSSMSCPRALPRRCLWERWGDFSAPSASEGSEGRHICCWIFRWLKSV